MVYLYKIYYNKSVIFSEYIKYGGIILIELKNVTKKYGDYTAIDNVSFRIEKGEIVGFLGKNGAGKTTTLKLITGLISPTEGKIFIKDKELNNKSKEFIGFMPENTPLYQDMTVKEYVSYIAELKKIKRAERKEMVQKIIKDLGLIDVEGKIIKNISRGYKQRVSMAGALVGNPEIIIMDEPTVGLDPKQVIEIRNLIKSLAKNHTVLFSSHVLSEVDQICEKVIIIDSGKIVIQDTLENIENKINKNVIVVEVEDPKNNIQKIKEQIKEIQEINYIKNMGKDIKEYEIIVDKKADVRKQLFSALQSFDVNVVELKTMETTLEEAFMKLTEK